MASKMKVSALAMTDRLIAEGEIVRGTPTEYSILGDFYKDVQKYAKWHAGCANLLRTLGRFAEPWQEPFQENKYTVYQLQEWLGILHAIREAIDRDELVNVEDWVMAEAFADLLEQADYLLSGGYYLAAGVLGRAVLEEHLRKLCDRSNCLPSKVKPTLNDFKLELQRATRLDRIELANVDAMAATGNAAAHNLPTLTNEAVERLVRDVREFLVRHPLS